MPFKKDVYVHKKGKFFHQMNYYFDTTNIFDNIKKQLKQKILKSNL